MRLFFRKLIVGVAGILLFVTVLSSFADNNKVMQYVVWNNKPINIVLPIGKTREIIFPHTVQFGMSKALSKNLQVTNNAGVLKFTAQKPFVSQRVEINDNIAGHMVLVNLSAAFNQTQVPLAILYEKPTAQSEQAGWLKTPHALSGDMAYITLTRFAEQQLYAPKRLLRNPYGIQLVNSFVNARGEVSPHNWFYGLFIDRSTVNIPWAEWSGGNYYVTAVLVRNQLNTPINLTRNIVNICGRHGSVWKSVTFFPSWHLGCTGSLNDTTVAFLVSSVPFDQAVKACSPFKNCEDKV
jgi:integrating conjugative element protein (TIGR03749 family)